MRVVFGSRHRRVQVGQALHDDVLPLFERDRVRCARDRPAAPARSLRASCRCWRELLGEEVGRFFRRRRRAIRRLCLMYASPSALAISRRQPRIGRAIGDVDQPAVAHGSTSRDCARNRSMTRDCARVSAASGASMAAAARTSASTMLNGVMMQAPNRQPRRLIEQRMRPEIQRLDRATREARGLAESRYCVS